MRFVNALGFHNKYLLGSLEADITIKSYTEYRILHENINELRSQLARANVRDNVVQFVTR